MRRLLLVSLAAFAVGAPASAATVHRVWTAKAGAVRATLTFDRTTATALPCRGITNVRASVFAAGRLVASQRFAGRLCPYKLRVVDLGTPTVLVDLYTGGAHCCFLTKFFRIQGSRLAGQLQRNWGDPGYRLADIDGDGRLELRSGDDAFAYAFTDYAESGLPIAVWRLENGRLVDRTRDFPGAVAADARQWLGAYRQAARRHGDVRGLLAPYVADETLLGTPDMGWALVDAALARGELGTGIGDVPTGKAYVAFLRRFLVKNGYR